MAYGAVVTLKNHRTGGGYLHSHWHLYPEGVGARQQQVTAYTHKDENNRFVLQPVGEEELEKEEGEVRLVRSGQLVRLEHVVTHRNLHSHKEQAPLTKKHFQVTGYGEVLHLICKEELDLSVMHSDGIKIRNMLRLSSDKF